MYWANRVLVGCLAIASWSGSSTSANFGSTSTSTGPASSPTYPACPARFPTLAAATKGPLALVPTGATALVDCGYGYPEVPSGPTKRISPGPLAGPRVSGAAVGGYALLLDAQPPARPAQQVCLHDELATGKAPKDLLVFAYPGGRMVEVAWAEGCNLSGAQFPGAAAWGDGRSASLSFSVTTVLTGLLAVLYGPGAPFSPPGSPSRPAPDLVGLPIDAALATAGRNGRTIEVDQELLDPARPLGTVEVQTPPPGEPASTDGPLSLVVSVPGAPACRAAQLRGLATTDEPGAGTAFGTLLLRNVGAQPCTLLGPLEVTAVLTELGQPLAVTKSVPVPQPIVLSALSPVPSQRAQPSTLAADVLLASTDYAGNCPGPVGHASEWLITLPDHSQLAVPAAGQVGNFAPIIVCGHEVPVASVSFTGWSPS